MNLFDSIIAGKLGGGGGGGYNWKELGLPYTEGGLVELLPEAELMLDEGGTMVPGLVLNEGATYLVKYNGVEYTCVAQAITGVGMTGVLIGNGAPLGMAVGNNEPFAMAYADAEGATIIMDFTGAAAITVGIYQDGEVIHKLDNKYIDAEWMATTKEVKGEELLAERKYLMTVTFINNVNTAGLAEGKKVLVICDGVEYECPLKRVVVDGEAGLIAGNQGAANGLGWDNGEPFMLGIAGNEISVAVATTGSVLSVYAIEEVPDKLPEKFLPTAAAVDMTAYESEGKIVETYPDGSEVTTTIEFDASGNPVKITDSFGNVTELAW